MRKDIVYKATISTCNTNDTKHYIGMTSNTFKERFRNHIKSFNHKKYSNETELSKYVWHLKENNTDYTIKWSKIKNSILYTGGSKRCNLCLEEKAMYCSNVLAMYCSMTYRAKYIFSFHFKFLLNVFLVE